MQYDEFTVFRRKSQKLIDIYKGMGETDKIMKTPGILLSGSNRIIENYTLIFLQHASAREPGPMWQATLKDSGSI